MKVNLAKIKFASGLVTQFKFEEPGQEFNFDGEKISFVQPLKVWGEVANLGDIFKVTGKAETVIRLNCSRCLDTYQLPVKLIIDADFSQLVATDDDVRSFLGDEISLDDIIMEALILELPLKFLCKPDCKGLCAQCGTDLNKSNCNCQEKLDPRLSVLGEYFKAEDKPKGV